jgi:hypothetical protein
MGRRRGPDWFGWILTLPLLVVVLAPPAAAEEMNVTLGLKEQYVTLRRTLKLESQTSGGLQTHRIDAPSSDAAWMPGLVMNVSYRHWFVGAQVSGVSLNVAEQPSSFSSPLFTQKSKVDLTELDLAIGYTIMTGVSPYLGYMRNQQRTDLNCAGCTKTDVLGQVGPGLLLDYPLTNKRWAAYMNLALIQGFLIEGGLSYAGIRWPLVGTVGFGYQQINYPSGKVSCGQTGFSCFRDKDVISGPILSLHYVF